MRYVVVEGEGPSFTVKDNQAKKWNMPENAISLFLGNREAAQAIADILNREWAAFNRNPY